MIFSQVSLFFFSPYWQLYSEALCLVRGNYIEAQKPTSISAEPSIFLRFPSLINREQNGVRQWRSDRLSVSTDVMLFSAYYNSCPATALCTF